MRSKRSLMVFEVFWALCVGCSVSGSFSSSVLLFFKLFLLLLFYGIWYGTVRYDMVRHEVCFTASGAKNKRCDFCFIRLTTITWEYGFMRTRNIKPALMRDAGFPSKQDNLLFNAAPEHYRHAEA